MEIENGRIIGNVMRLIIKLRDEKNFNAETLVGNIIISHEVRKFYCKRMQMSVNICNLTHCKFYSSCVPT
jgi:hypothetical protein